MKKYFFTIWLLTISFNFFSSSQSSENSSQSLSQQNQQVSSNAGSKISKPTLNPESINHKNKKKDLDGTPWWLIALIALGLLLILGGGIALLIIGIKASKLLLIILGGILALWALWIIFIGG